MIVTWNSLAQASGPRRNATGGLRETNDSDAKRNVQCVELNLGARRRMWIARRV